MGFFKKYPVTLNELLLAPVIFRENLPQLQGLPAAGAGVMRDLAEFGGYRPGAIRTAMSRLRASGVVEAFPDGAVTRYRMGAVPRSVSLAVRSRFDRPDGFLLAVFAFAAEDTRERQSVRDALRAYGFQKLAQNVYINGQIDTAELERILRGHGLSDHVFFFRCPGGADPRQDARLAQLFGVKRRAAVLKRFEADLRALLDDPGAEGDELARRYLAAGPVHYRVTFAEEPPLPARCLPPDYPLERLSVYFEPTERRVGALVNYYRRLSL